MTRSANPILADQKRRPLQPHPPRCAAAHGVAGPRPEGRADRERSHRLRGNPARRLDGQADDGGGNEQLADRLAGTRSRSERRDRRKNHRRRRRRLPPALRARPRTIRESARRCRISGRCRSASSRRAPRSSTSRRANVIDPLSSGRRDFVTGYLDELRRCLDTLPAADLRPISRLPRARLSGRPTGLHHRQRRQRGDRLAYGRPTWRRTSIRRLRAMQVRRFRVTSLTDNVALDHRSGQRLRLRARLRRTAEQPAAERRPGDCHLGIRQFAEHPRGDRPRPRARRPHRGAARIRRRARRATSSTWRWSWIGDYGHVEDLHLC